MSKQPRTLAEFFGVDKVQFNLIRPSQFAHVIIDAQKRYCDPDYKDERGNEQTHQTCQRIARIAPKFRDAGLTTAYVYYDKKLSKDFLNANGGPHLVQIHRNDIKVPKNDNSAIEASNLKDILECKGISRLIISGFNANACVLDTVEDAIREGFQVAVLADHIGNDNWNQSSEMSYAIKTMADAGAFIATHGKAVEFLEHISAG